PRPTVVRSRRGSPCSASPGVTAPLSAVVDDDEDDDEPIASAAATTMPPATIAATSGPSRSLYRPQARTGLNIGTSMSRWPDEDRRRARLRLHGQLPFAAPASRKPSVPAGTGTKLHSRSASEGLGNCYSGCPHRTISNARSGEQPRATRSAISCQSTRPANALGECVGKRSSQDLRSHGWCQSLARPGVVVIGGSTDPRAWLAELSRF